MVTKRAGHGPTVFSLRLSAAKRSYVTIVFNCAGPGKVAFTDGRGYQIENVAGCSPHAVYGVGWRPKDSQVRLAVDPQARWQLEVWIRT